ncbi:nif-specific transcriptional activator NifA [Paraburkholderia caballeronis]|uniref:nif-specific transcriptional activator NifA n=1 Tax=Paraburkholderia caballeronis TaxID=416943 RepID=UPI001065EBCB|nr:nif-specific transcriptional activator NifA [Paraburkholderia caballeronis]TDV15760.1 Fis family transcriptional regulator NifA [Paraburkholderia caballeronis]TDV18015.1 Fis family transcriptional regulator NifA [Paraburkholderia caballeronis]TDV26371.1 Fis family transcriptional regulator NifA [Paraburkholderia caballeronis]
MQKSSAGEARRELDAVYEVSKTLVSSLDVAQTFRTSLQYLLHALEWRRAFVVVAEADGQLHGMCSAGLSSDEHQRIRFHPGEGIVGRVYKSGLPAVVPDVRDEPMFLDRTGSAGEPGEFGEFGTARVALLATPIRQEHHTLGVLAVFCVNPDGARMFAGDLYLMKIVSTLMGQALLLHRSVSAAHDRMQEEVRRMQKAIRPFQPLDQVVGVSEPMRRIFEQVHQVAPARTTVLLRGESGTGKEVIARAIHRLSPRREQAFVSVNCAALTESLLESELFGHEKGAFTGAQGQRKGRFELAHGGTLFLDEIGDISPSFQAKLLRVLQEREFERVGGAAPVKVDVRLILATNRNLERMVKEGEFRADLYYRINVVSIQLPPLRERREDIPAMAQYFLDRFNRDNSRSLRFSPDAMRVLTSCYWPGNVRELENCVERTATMTHNDVIDRLAFLCQEDQCLTRVLHHIEREDAVRPARLVDIPIREIPGMPAGHAGAGSRDGDLPFALPDGLAGELADDETAADLHDGAQDGKPEGERERLIWAMERCGWVQAKAARLLRITPRQIGYALHKYGIEVRRF